MTERSDIFSHIDEDGKARMVDVSHKAPQLRTALAKGRIRLRPETVDMIRNNQIKKGDVLTVARIAGILAAKWTHHLIPLCHPLNLTHIDVRPVLQDKGVEVVGTVRCVGNTGVEMEALTAVNVALLTVYDMCKAVEKEMVMESIQLIDKTKEDVE